jgi:hypothetical protein
MNAVGQVTKLVVQRSVLIIAQIGLVGCVSGVSGLSNKRQI